jgi:ubiquinone/menaquinone biosynthesis C-methylase UbiE
MNRPEGHPWLAATMDFAMRSLEKLRPRVLAEATGDVLEIGVGTGLNFAHYADIQSLTGIEPDPHMIARARKRLATLSITAELHQTGAEALPFEDEQFDTVVATWVFCTIPEGNRAAAEIARVLRPGGRLLFIEHTHSTHGPSSAMQRLVDPIWHRTAGGCHLDRDPVAMLEAAGLAVENARGWGRQRWTITPMLRGDAIKPAR